jgi:hypothetical protein
MYSLSLVESRLGIVLGALCGFVGVALTEPESGLLIALGGYFLGKSIQSTLWTFRCHRTT